MTTENDHLHATRITAAAAIASGLLSNPMFTMASEYPDRFTAAAAVAVQLVGKIEARLKLKQTVPD